LVTELEFCSYKLGYPSCRLQLAEISSPKPETNLDMPTKVIKSTICITQPMSLTSGEQNMRQNYFNSPTVIDRQNYMKTKIGTLHCFSELVLPVITYSSAA